MNNIVDRIFQDLSKWFRNQAPLTNTSVEDLPFRVLKLITRVKINTVAARSYGLFETIMRPAVAQEKKMEAAPLALHMEAARLALHTAYPPGLESVPPVQDPSLILDFLRYHIDPNVKSEDRAHAIASAMRAIRSTSNGPLSQSWIWCIKNAGELLTRLQQSSGHWEEFKWWYMILWRYRGKLDASIWGRMDDIAKNGGDKIDLEECKVAIEKEIERVKGSGGAPDILKSLDDSCARLNELIDDREKVRADEFSCFWVRLISFFPSSCGHQSYLSYDLILFTSCGITGDGRKSSPHRPLIVYMCLFSSRKLRFCVHRIPDRFIPHTIAYVVPHPRDLVAFRTTMYLCGSSAFGLNRLVINAASSFLDAERRITKGLKVQNGVCGFRRSPYVWYNMIIHA